MCSTLVNISNLSEAKAPFVTVRATATSFNWATATVVVRMKTQHRLCLAFDPKSSALEEQQRKSKQNVTWYTGARKDV